MREFLKPLNEKNAFKLIIENEETVTLTLTCSASKNSTVSIQPLFRFKTITLDELEKWYNNEIELDNKSIVLVIENNNDSIAKMANTYNYQINELGNYKLFFNNEFT